MRIEIVSFFLFRSFSIYSYVIVICNDFDNHLFILFVCLCSFFTLHSHEQHTYLLDDFRLAEQKASKYKEVQKRKVERKCLENLLGLNLCQNNKLWFNIEFHSDERKLMPQVVPSNAVRENQIVCRKGTIYSIHWRNECEISFFSLISFIFFSSMIVCFCLTWVWPDFNTCDSINRTNKNQFLSLWVNNVAEQSKHNVKKTLLEQ